MKAIGVMAMPSIKNTKGSTSTPRIGAVRAPWRGRERVAIDESDVPQDYRDAILEDLEVGALQ